MKLLTSLPFIVYVLVLAPLAQSCDSPAFRPKPKFEVVEDVVVNVEGFLDLGLEIKAKVHNFGAAGSQRIRFVGYTGYSLRNTDEGALPSWDKEFSHTETIFLNEGETVEVSHVFKQINILDEGLRGSVEVLN